MPVNVEMHTSKCYVSKYVDLNEKKSWKVDAKAIRRFYDIRQTDTNEFSK